MADNACMKNKFQGLGTSFQLKIQWNYCLRNFEMDTSNYNLYPIYSTQGVVVGWPSSCAYVLLLLMMLNTINALITFPLYWQLEPHAFIQLYVRISIWHLSNCAHLNTSYTYIHTYIGAYIHTLTQETRNLFSVCSVTISPAFQFPFSNTKYAYVILLLLYIRTYMLVTRGYFLAPLRRCPVALTIQSRPFTLCIATCHLLDLPDFRCH